jgi:hypothetical protein
MENKLTGKISHINAADHFGPLKTFKQTFLLDITTDNQTTEVFVEIEIVGTNQKLASGLKVGQMVDCYFNLRGRKYQKNSGDPVRAYASFHAWRIEQVGTSNLSPATPNNSAPYRTEAGGQFND